MSFLARLSLANRGLIALITIVVVAFGAYITPALQQQLLPSLSFPQVSVVATYAGAAPQIVEDRVTVPLEEGVRGVAGVTGVTSTSRESSASIQVAFDFGTDIDDAQSKIQQVVGGLSSRLPDGVEPQVVVGSTDDLPVIQLAAASDGSQQRLAERLDTQVVPALTGIEGVKEATVTGTRDQVITITPDTDELKKHGLDTSAISTAIQGAGQPIPAGSLTQSDTTLSVQVGARFASIADLKDLYLAPAAQASPASPAQPTAQAQRPGSPPQAKTVPAKPKPVRLGDVATVKLGLAEAATLTRTDGKPSLGVSITMKPDGNAVSISEDVRAKLPALATALGTDAALTIVFDQAPEVEKSIESLTTEGLLGLAMAVLVILVFLFSVRSTLVTVVSIPLSVLIALIGLWVKDYSLNMLTLGALTIAIGRVVDDSIVVLENIKRHLSYGERKRQAIENGVREVAGAVTASTLTTVAVFLPIAFVGGFVGELFGPFSITVTVALIASLLVSLTVVPVLSYWFLKPPKDGDRHKAEEKERRSLLQRAYVPVIRFATRHRLTTVAGALAILIGTLALVPSLQTSFIDNAGQNTVSVTQNLPVGTSLASADAKAKEVEKILTGLNEIKSYQVTVGGASGVGFGGGRPGGGGGGGTARASYSLTLHEGSDTAAVENTLRDRLGKLTDAGQISIGESGGFGGDKLEVLVHASEQDTLRDASRAVQQTMAAMPGVTEATSTLADTAPRIDVTVDRKKAAEHGLSEAAIGQAVSQAFRDSTVTQLTFDGTTADVLVHTGDAPVSLGELRKLDLPGKVELSNVAEVKQVNGPVSVTRIDGDRTVTVSGKSTGANLGAISADLDSRLAKLTLPAGATYSIGGASADQDEAFGSLGLALVAAIALVFFVMVATFRSLIQPLLLLVSIPFAATGAIGLLLITGTSLGLAAMIGLLMLVGIVVTNAIVLLDLINQYRRQGMPLYEAVVEGGRNRLRPILMTALATIFALLPMALGITGGGGFISKPLAIVVIGGLISSTLLTLVLVPTLYTVVESRKEKIRTRRAGRADAPPLAETPKEPAHSS
ncbi:efflux RND transporter permease subunit [Nonomuraea sp. NEAU-A123]|uniref:efflux RND transporter permease subunit n=1 Tax=Nonomuraea sp. NEAU-A123 TaxID=2839649 RepID=UPI001BE4C26D|nr:efflux RND transporter permease subunit [Nonomuraea sp. NEAU-A123]MBT2227105.1 efflux RND transporter permease subunit [Nonomuraea sp. NEAU-A123]